MSRFRIAGCSALITGASAGLGAEFARQLAPQARRLVLVARRRDRLEAVRQELQQRHQALTVDIFDLDLRSTEETEKLIGKLHERGIEIDFVINNAGLGDLGAFAESPWERVDAMLKVNMLALTTLTHRFLPGMLEARRGAILNVGSTAGFLPLPSFAVYAATKAYVNGFTEALRMEVGHRGISVTLLCPGPVATEFGQVAARPGGARKFNPPKLFYISGQRVVRAALRGIERGRARVIPGKRLWLPMWAAELTPKPILRFVLGLGERFNPSSVKEANSR